MEKSYEVLLPNGKLKAITTLDDLIVILQAMEEENYHSVIIEIIDFGDGRFRIDLTDPRDAGWG